MFNVHVIRLQTTLCKLHAARFAQHFCSQHPAQRTLESKTKKREQKRRVRLPLFKHSSSHPSNPSPFFICAPLFPLPSERNSLANIGPKLNEPRAHGNGCSLLNVREGWPSSLLQRVRISSPVDPLLLLIRLLPRSSFVATASAMLLSLLTMSMFRKRLL